MKNLFLTALFLLFSFGVIAQTGDDASFVEKQFPGDAIAARVAEKAIAKNADSKTSGVRTTWLANRPKDNWFISLEGGANILISEHWADYPLKENVSFKMFGGALGKWFSPVWGLRVSGGEGALKGYQPSASGLWYSPSGYIMGNPTYVADYHFLDGDGNNPLTYTHLTLDFMVNLKNLFTAYNPKGFFNPVVYAGVGTVRTWGSASNSDKFLKTVLDIFGDKGSNHSVKGVQNLTAKAGLQLNFRICDPLQLYLAAEGLLVPENFDRYLGDRLYEGVASAKLGLTYRFNFRHFIKAEFCDQAMIDALIRENNELRNRKFECPPVPACPPCPEPKVVEKQEVKELEPVFFVINSSTVRTEEMIKVVRAADYLGNNPSAKLELVGYADKNTGNPTYNMQISKRRAESVAKVLTDKFGISKDRLIVSYKGDTVQPFAKNEENRVTIFVK